MVYLLLGIFIVLAGLFGLFLLYAIQPALSPDDRPASNIVSLSPSPQAQENEVPPVIKIVTYNVGYAGGNKNNKGSVLQREEVQENLEQIVQSLKKIKPDILLLQEVDFYSQRSFDQDQFKYLGERLGFPYGAYVINWNKKYIAWPYWPPQAHFGRIVSGQAVLSRFPILDQELIWFERPSENPFWYNWFYLDRVAQKLRIQVGLTAWSVYNVHLEAYAQKTRKKQIERLALALKKDKTPLKIVGGDFNQAWADPRLSPKELSQSKKILTDFGNTSGLQLAQGTRTLLSIPSWDPVEALDHLFYSPSLHLEEVQVLADSMASDHLAVMAGFKVPQIGRTNSLDPRKTK